MNVLGISGTPRENGNSDILLKYSLNPFIKHNWNIKHYRIRELKIFPCDACDSCKNDNVCIIKDDMHIIYESFIWCDAIIVSTPVYSRNVSSQLLAIFDRHYAVSASRPLEGKIGGAIAVGRGTCGGQTIAINAIYNWMLSCGVICVPGELNGVTAVADKPGDILKQEKRLKQAEILGNNILKVAEKLR